MKYYNSRVGAYGFLSVIKGMHMIVCLMRGRYSYDNMGGTAEVKAFVPAIAGARALFFSIKNQKGL